MSTVEIPAWVRASVTRWNQSASRPPAESLPRPAKVAWRLERLDTVEQVRRRLETFGGDGWWCTTDRVFVVPSDATGLPLSAELTRGDTSLHLRHHGDHWTVLQITDGEGEPAWQTSEERLTIHGGVTLTYAVYWQPHEGALRPAVARLARVSRKESP